MKVYYGTKRVQAEPVVREMLGYRVVYPSDGYESWSPKEAFEAVYRESGHMNFGHALAALKEGRKVCRALWLDASDFGYLRLFPGPVLSFVQDDVETVWETCHGDILAEDWCVVE
jgi:hypothetical protein